MLINFDILIKGLNQLKEETTPDWGQMSSLQMMSHCNKFIEVSLGDEKIDFKTKLFARFFGKFFLRYLKSIAFDINKYPKNSKTFKELEVGTTLESFLIKKNRLEKSIQKVMALESKYIRHGIYGNIKTDLFKRLIYFHTSYHFNQFGVFGEAISKD